MSPGCAADAVRRSCCSLDNHAAFPEFCSKSEKWFRGAGELFRHRGRTKQSCKNYNDFNEMQPMNLSAIGPA
jgi:hypothetical protein